MSEDLGTSFPANVRVRCADGCHAFAAGANRCLNCGEVFLNLVTAGATSNDVVMPRLLAERLLGLVERVLAFSGDNPDRDLILLQHELVVRLGPPAPTNSYPVNSTQIEK